MEESTQPRPRKPFRGRHLRRPRANAQPPAETPVAGDGQTAEAPPANGNEMSAPVPVAEFNTDIELGQLPPGAQLPRRKNRGPGVGGTLNNPPQFGGKRPRRPLPAEGAEGGEGEAAMRTDNRPPRPNDGNRGNNNRQGKQRFDRPQGGRNKGGGQPWGGKPGSSAQPGNSFSDRGGENRRNRGSPADEQPVRLAALLAERGLCTPREADSYIERGWVIVNGERVSGGGLRVHPAAEVRLAPEARGEQSRRATILFHKPVDCTVGAEPGATETGYVDAAALIAAETLDDRYDGPIFQASHIRQLMPAGSLDVDSIGLQVMTQDDRVVQQLSGAEATIDMEYLVDLEGTITEKKLAAFGSGGEIDGLPLVPAQVDRLGDRQLKIILTSGDDRQLLRLCEQAGLKVTSLKRTRIGHVRLGDLPQGKWRYLRDDENF